MTSHADLATTVRDLLGTRLTVYIAAATNSQTLTKWIDGTDPIPVDAVNRLTIARDAAHIITTRDSPRVAQAWFQGMNPLLGDVAPARIIREANPTDDIARDVLAAARHAIT